MLWQSSAGVSAAVAGGVPPSLGCCSGGRDALRHSRRDAGATGRRHAFSLRSSASVSCFNVSAADHRDIHDCLWQFVPVEQECRHRYRSAGLGQCFGIARKALRGASDFVLGDGHDVIHVAANVLKIDRADALGPQPVRQSAGSLFRCGHARSFPIADWLAHRPRAPVRRRSLLPRARSA